MSGTLTIKFGLDMPAAAVEVVSPDLEVVHRVMLDAGRTIEVKVQSDASFLRIYLPTGKVVTLIDPGNLAREISLQMITKQNSGYSRDPLGNESGIETSSIQLRKCDIVLRDARRIIPGILAKNGLEAQWQLHLNAKKQPPLTLEIREPFGTVFHLRVPGNASRLWLCAEALDHKLVSNFSLRIATLEPKAEAAASYLYRGDIYSADAMTQWVHEASSFLYDKMEDPYAATIGAYLLLRLKKFDQMRDWARSLATRFDFLPDGCIIWAWQLIHQEPSNMPEIRKYLLMASERGLPVYSDGVRLLTDGLRRMGEEGQLAREKLVRSVGIFLWSSPLTASISVNAGAESPTDSSSYEVAFANEFPLRFPTSVKGLKEEEERLFLSDEEERTHFPVEKRLRSSYGEVTEQKRLNEAREMGVPWKKWGPYLSERQWGTVREDYSKDGNAWDYFTHDQARSRAYRWGEDGLAGYCDDKQQLCFALALWNGRDPILKERMFGLTNSESNHGEDVKEYYFYLDSTPTHSYMKYLYKYPQAEFPYLDLVQTNKHRSREEFEYELIDTGIFDEDRYFDVFVEYAKADPEDTLIRITVHNRGPEAAELHVLPTLWFRNTWSWEESQTKPVLGAIDEDKIYSSHPQLGGYTLQCEGTDELLFTENETNAGRLWGLPNPSPYVKDAFHNYVISGVTDAVNPAKRGTKAAAHYILEVPAKGSKVIRLRLNVKATRDAFEKFDQIFESRRADANEFYNRITPKALSEDESRVHRQALAGMLWSKQYYYFDLDIWLAEHDAHPMTGSGKGNSRNAHWFHMLNSDVISMPDKWEYPWYAAWDLAFHTIALSLVDFDFAKDQLLLMLRNLYAHPNGQIPAYEWNFGDVNPPVHAWATLFLYRIETQLGRADIRFLERSFQGLMQNFNWWVNRKDPQGRDVFAGGFLGLDNIGVFDRSAELPTGGHLDQADGTAWMAFYCLSMLEIALILTEYDPIYEDIAYRFLEHFAWITYAMDRIGESHDEMWDEEDGFFYDLLHLPNEEAVRLKIRSMVGLLPLCAATVFEGGTAKKYPRLFQMIELFRKRHPEVAKKIATADDPKIGGYEGRRLVAVCNKEKLTRILKYMLDENEFFGPYGIRSLSKYHLEHPFVFYLRGQEYKVQYLPAESNTGMFGGNSNWRGPIWMPVNGLIIRGLLQMYPFYGPDFKVECPTGSGTYMTLSEVAKEIGNRLSKMFLRDSSGKRPVYGGTKKFQEDPHWRDYILFYEYFHGDNGAGLGASHQTGWTGLIARTLNMFALLRQEDLLRVPKTMTPEFTRPQIREEFS